MRRRCVGGPVGGLLADGGIVPTFFLLVLLVGANLERMVRLGAVMMRMFV
jgi:hypothetical protein